MIPQLRIRIHPHKLRERDLKWSSKWFIHSLTYQVLVPDMLYTTFFFQCTALYSYCTSVYCIGAFNTITIEMELRTQHNNIWDSLWILLPNSSSYVGLVKLGTKADNSQGQDSFFDFKVTDEFTTSHVNNTSIQKKDKFDKKNFGDPLTFLLPKVVQAKTWIYDSGADEFPGLDSLLAFPRHPDIQQEENPWPRQNSSNSKAWSSTQSSSLSGGRPHGKSIFYIRKDTRRAKVQHQVRWNKLKQHGSDIEGNHIGKISP